jgi:hypothetical protein
LEILVGVDLAPLIEQDTDIELIPYEESKAPDTKAHIVNPPANMHIFQPGMEAQDIVDIARATGNFVVALCGYKFIPRHNPDKHDACERCIEIAGDIIRSEGE